MGNKYTFRGAHCPIVATYRDIFHIMTRSHVYLNAKIMQTERNKACFKLPRCSLSYAKIMQVECNQTCLNLLRRNLSYAKIEKTNDITMNTMQEKVFVLCKFR